MNCGSNSMCGDGGDGSMALLPTGSSNVTAGMNYSCTVTATNKFASVQRDTEYVLASSGVPSEPRITGVTAGVHMFTLTVQLYAGHTSSVYFDVAIVDVPNNMMIRVVNLKPDESISSSLMEYTITVPFSQRGHYHFIVSSRNSFGSSMESEMYPSMGMIGVEVLQPASTPTIPAATPTRPMGSVTPVTTGTTQPPGDVSTVSAGVIAGAVVAVVAVIIIILMVVLIVGFLIYHNKGQPKNILIECNEAYGVVRGGGGVSLSVELKDNAAYSAVNVHTAHNQSTIMDINTAYEVISGHVYENPNIQI